MKKHKMLTRIIIVMAALMVIGIALVLGINQYMVKSVAKQIISEEEAVKQEDIDCILVLGAGIKEDNTPSDMLKDRLLQAVALYEQGVSQKIIMSGDHGRGDYDEVNVMKQFAIDAGVDSSDIFMDHAGFSTYESVYRARTVFEADKVVIVTQGYHLSRALYLAKGLGIKAYGVAADPRAYAGQVFREVREILARNKDFLTSIMQPEPTYLGEVIPVSGDGNITNDK